MILRLLGVLSLVLFLSGSCMKKFECNYDPCINSAPAAETQILQDFITNNSIIATKHCSGMFYRIESPGTGATPDVCKSYLGVRYKGMLSNGNEFETKTTTVGAYLSQMIAGWKNAIPLIKAGGRIVLYIPPSLGFGYQDAGPIPANSYLIFEVDLDEVY